MYVCGYVCVCVVYVCVWICVCVCVVCVCVCVYCVVFTFDVRDVRTDSKIAKDQQDITYRAQ